MADAGVSPYNGTVPTGGDSLDNLNIYYDVSLFFFFLCYAVVVVCCESPTQQKTCGMGNAKAHCAMT